MSRGWVLTEKYKTKPLSGKTQMQVLFTTVVRGAPVEQGGELIQLDWDSKTVINKHPIMPTNPSIHDPNPRGNSRGGRGIEIIGDQIVVASYHTLKFFDRRLSPLRDFSHPLMVGLHEIYAHPEGGTKIWVTSTSIDAALQFDLHREKLTDQYWPREMPVFQQALGITPLEIDKTADNRLEFLESKHFRGPSHLHLNAVTCWQGDVYALFPAFGVVANLSKESIALQAQRIKRAHNLMILPDGIAIINDTYGRTIRFYDLNTKKLVKAINLRSFPEITQLVHWQYKAYFAIRESLRKMSFPLSPLPRPFFVRGMDLVGNRLFVGIAPATIVCLDWEQNKLLDLFSYSNNLEAVVHGIKVIDPDSG